MFFFGQIEYQYQQLQYYLKPLSGVHVMLSDVPSGKFRRFFEEIWETNKGDPKSDQKDVNQQTVLDLSNASSCVRRLITHKSIRQWHQINC